MNTDLCTHLIESGNLTTVPMVLIHTGDTTAFTCPTCAADYCITLLDTGTQAREVLETLILEACDHGQGTCCRCLESFKDELSKRWMRYRIAGDKPASNRLGRLRTAIRKRYGTEQATLPAYRNANILGMAGVRGQAGQRWTAAKQQRLTALAPPVHTVVVVKPVTTN
jgi:hypothetical protein